MKRIATIAAVAASVGFLLSGPNAVAAAPSHQAPAVATSCYGSAKSFSTDSADQWPQGANYATTTSNCADINVKPTSGMWVQTCFLGANFYCNKATWITGGTWGTAATGVLNGTAFYLQFDRPTHGLVAY
ncbi:hypothetical protein ACGFYM_33580 [Streptomyces sp. NPDC048231]|uniref:hypothetical protein n=1 Tax=Streptomyces sp. NPDC048231 TaxID=3365519 RepID=UPI0037110E50